VRLVATDLDGTLLRSDGSTTERTRAALAGLEAKGVPVVLVTGRPVRWMRDVAALAGHHGVAICSNGAVLYDLHDERILDTDVLDGDAAAAVVGVLRASIEGIAFAVEQAHGGFAHEQAYSELIRWDQPEKTVAPAEELVATRVVKLLGRHPTMPPDDFVAAARTAIGDLATLTYSSGDGLLEISGIGVTKASGLARYADDQGVRAAEVVAFGDMLNDIPMLTWAGHGVAVANAHPDVIDVADEVTGSNDDDGVAAWLERHLL
jgi:Cof subfamily protein (haloacid dehalogenase superfamily)